MKLVVLIFLKSFFLLGLTSFGGPVAHIGFFRNTFVKEKKWLDDDTYMEFVSLCNFLPVLHLVRWVCQLVIILKVLRVLYWPG